MSKPINYKALHKMMESAYQEYYYRYQGFKEATELFVRGKEKRRRYE